MVNSSKCPKIIEDQLPKQHELRELPIFYWSANLIPEGCLHGHQRVQCKLLNIIQIDEQGWAKTTTLYSICLSVPPCCISHGLAVVASQSMRGT